MRIKAVRENGGFTVIENSFIRDESIGRNEKVVYLVLASFADQDTGQCYPSIATIEKFAGLTDKPVMKAIRELERIGWIKCQRRSNTSTLYWIGKTPTTSRTNSDDPIGEIPIKQEPINKNQEQYKEIINYLNEKTESTFRHESRATQQLINARLKDKFTVKGFKLVIDAMCHEWGKDATMAKFLRPLTLFGTKMENYYEIGLKKLKEEILDGSKY
tara:strand:+ start:1678 stop:2325 length:648 start_codon:yes stop_codon:yes gene_type:complete